LNSKKNTLADLIRQHLFKEKKKTIDVILEAKISSKTLADINSGRFIKRFMMVYGTRYPDGRKENKLNQTIDRLSVFLKLDGRKEILDLLNQEAKELLMMLEEGEKAKVLFGDRLVWIESHFLNEQKEIFGQLRSGLQYHITGKTRKPDELLSSDGAAEVSGKFGVDPYLEARGIKADGLLRQRNRESFPAVIELSPAVISAETDTKDPIFTFMANAGVGKDFSNSTLANVLREKIEKSTSVDFFVQILKSISDHEWGDYKWQMRNRFSTLEQFQLLELTDVETKAFRLLKEHNHRVAISPYYMSLLIKENAEQYLRKTVVPRPDEFVSSKEEIEFFKRHSDFRPMEGLIHTQPESVDLQISNFFPHTARYDASSRKVSEGVFLDESRLTKIFEYLYQHKEVQFVSFTGDEPLCVDDEKLEWILDHLRKINHIKCIRLHTTMPAVCPQRITYELAKVLSERLVDVSVHFLHPQEITPESLHACKLLFDAGVRPDLETVLVKGVNDDIQILRNLYRELRNVARPYRLHHCTPLPGTAEFRTTISKGIGIAEELRRHPTGESLCGYFINVPGRGKIPLKRESCIGREGGYAIIVDEKQRMVFYPDPEDTASARC
jgi:lysine 2,3-aminomutase